MNPSEQIIGKEIPPALTKGYLESSEETLCLVPFKEHPKGLQAYEQRYIYENKAGIDFNLKK